MSAGLVLGAMFFFAAPWVMRGFVTVDRLLIRGLLGPDPMATRVRSLEQARTQTVDASAATLRRIERDLHDGTQAQLVALAMRLGMAKEKLDDDPEHVDLDQVRELVDAAHRGAKEAIVELRDIARGIHPPALDIGLEGALATLAARSAVPTELSVDLPTGRRRPSRPSPTSASPSSWPTWPSTPMPRGPRSPVHEQGTWLRLVVRDDGTGGAQLTTVGSSSSGLAGLTDRVHAVDGRLNLVSPPGGPTVVTVDLPLRDLMVGSLRVAIAEDSAILRDGLVQLLVDRGFTITGAVGDPAALRSSVAAEPARRGRDRHPHAADLHRRRSPAGPGAARPPRGPRHPAVLPVHRDPLRRRPAGRRRRRASATC